MVNRTTTLLLPLWLLGACLLLATTSAHAQANRPIYVPIVTRGTPATAPSGPAWLTRLNQYRAAGNLPLVNEDAAMSQGNLAHAQYTIWNGILEHDEQPGKQGYSAAGARSAQNSNIMMSTDISTSDITAIDMWMAGPFHGIGMIDPHLATVGFGSYREARGAGKFQMAAGLNVLEGLTASVSNNVYPIIWPAQGSTVPAIKLQTEYPNPFTSCPGYSAPSGMSIMLQLGQGNITPRVTGYSISTDGVVLPSCEFDETNYVSSDTDEQELGRGVLDGRDAIVILPRAPLVTGKTYTVSITVNGTQHLWSFNVGA